MTLKNAQNVLLANACCDLGNRCEWCPWNDSKKCKEISFADVLDEAIEIIFNNSCVDSRLLVDE